MSEPSSVIDVYQLHVWLCEISPLIWRRLLVRSDSTIADLHYTVDPENLSQPQTGWLVSASSGRSPLIMMMQPAHLWDFPDRAHPWPLDRPRRGTIHLQCPVRAPMNDGNSGRRVLPT
jgi:Plasmid pRiA4b ORF-3-like protein